MESRSCWAIRNLKSVWGSKVLAAISFLIDSKAAFAIFLLPRRLSFFALKSCKYMEIMLRLSILWLTWLVLFK